MESSGALIIGGGLVLYAAGTYAKNRIKASYAKKSNHGNSKSSKNSQHGYEIFNKKTKNVVKTGVSGGKLNKDGTSRRAKTQVNKWNKAAGYARYAHRVVVKNVKGRDKILKWEQSNVNKLAKAGNRMYKHHRPKPKL